MRGRAICLFLDAQKFLCMKSTARKHTFILLCQREVNGGEETRMEKITCELINLADSQYKQFHCKLMPEISKEKVLGVRTPVLRKYAREIYEREDVDGCYNEADRCDLSQNIFEFQIKKTLEPMSNTNFYSFNCATPMVPTNLSKENGRRRRAG